MNIYLDIDGVLLANTNKSANFADDFLQYVLSRYPDTTYWLTTHCWRGQNRAMEVLRPALKRRTMGLIKSVKPTDWHEWKTDAIDFSQPFRWYDDDLFPEEKKVLEAFNALGSRVEVNLFADPNQLIDEIAKLKMLA